MRVTDASDLGRVLRSARQLVIVGQPQSQLAPTQLSPANADAK